MGVCVFPPAIVTGRCLRITAVQPGGELLRRLLAHVGGAWGPAHLNGGLTQPILLTLFFPPCSESAFPELRCAVLQSTVPRAP